MIYIIIFITRFPYATAQQSGTTASLSAGSNAKTGVCCLGSQTLTQPNIYKKILLENLCIQKKLYRKNDYHLSRL